MDLDSEKTSDVESYYDDGDVDKDFFPPHEDVWEENGVEEESDDGENDDIKESDYETQESDISEHELENESVNMVQWKIVTNDFVPRYQIPPKQDGTVLCDLSRDATPLQFF